MNILAMSHREFENYQVKPNERVLAVIILDKDLKEKPFYNPKIPDKIKHVYKTTLGHDEDGFGDLENVINMVENKINEVDTVLLTCPGGKNRSVTLEETFREKYMIIMPIYTNVIDTSLMIPKLKRYSRSL